MSVPGEESNTVKSMSWKDWTAIAPLKWLEVEEKWGNVRSKACKISRSEIMKNWISLLRRIISTTTFEIFATFCTFYKYAVWCFTGLT